MSDEDLMLVAMDLLAEWLSSMGLTEQEERAVLEHFLGKKARALS